MDQLFISMPRVANRSFVLEGHNKRSKIGNNALRTVRNNLNEQSLRHFIFKNCDNINDINKNIISILEMVRDVDATDNSKKNIMEYLKVNAFPKLYAENVNSVDQFISSNDMTPYSSVLDITFRDLSVIDRILNNDKSLSNRFDFDKVIKNNSSGNVEDIVEELCELIDTYTLSREAKFNIALENIQYSLYKNGIRNIPQETIVETITNYFLFNDHVITDRDYKGIKKVLKNNLTISESCMNTIGFVLEKTTEQFSSKISELANNCEDPKIKKLINSSLKIKNENSASEYINKAVITANKTNTSQKDAKNLFASIYMIPLCGYVSKAFIVSELKLYEMKNKTMNKIQDKEFVDAVNALFEDEEDLGMIAEFAENYIEESKPIEEDKITDIANFNVYFESEDYADSNDVKKVLDSFKTDQNKSISKFKNCLYKIYQKSPENIIDETPHILGVIRMAFIIGLSCIPTVGPAIALVAAFVDKMISMDINERQSSKLITALEAEKKTVKEKLNAGKGNKSELESYIKCLDRCIEKVDKYRYTITDDEIEGREYDNSDDDDDFNFGNDDLDFSFESRMLSDMAAINIIMEAKEDIELHSKIDDLVKRAISENGVFLGEVLTVLKEASDVFDIELIYEKYQPLKYIQLSIQETSALTTGFDIAGRYEPLNINSNNDLTNKEEKYELDSGYYIEACAVECARRLVLQEGSPVNTLKLTIQNFKKKAKDLSTKEKSMWQSLDATMSGFMKSIERSLTSDRREAIIKGSMIPSFSKCIKTGLTVGAAALINPIFGVITAMGMFGASKALNARERQLIYDEIETELKVVDKQLQLADNDGDIKQYRFLLQYQKKLERERQRIKYGMKVHGRDIPSSSAGRRED